MGVQRLMKYIFDNKVFSSIDIVEKAKPEEIEIIVDTNAFSRYLTEICLTKVVKDFKNDFLFFPVGEYDIMEEAYKDFHMSFREAGIKLIWVVDGPKGLDEACFKEKSKMWSERDKTSNKKFDDLFEACSQQLKLKHINNCGPIIGMESILEQLKEVDAEIINLLHGEADDFIADLYKKRNSFAILTNDTDFVIFENCNIIFDRFLNFNYDEDSMKLPFIDRATRGKIFRRPDQFFCPIVNSKNIMKSLHLTNHDQLVCVSIIQGNDFTRDDLKEYCFNTGITKKKFFSPNVQDVSNHIKNNQINTKNILEQSEIKKYLTTNPSLKDSIIYSTEFYTLKLVLQKSQIYQNVVDPLTNFLIKGISSGRINRYCFIIHHGIFFHAMCPEELIGNCRSIMDILGDIRRGIYPYLLDKKHSQLKELRSRYCDVQIVNVDHENIQADGISEGLKIFEGLWSINESTQLRYIEKFDIPKALILYLLKYFKKINQNENLCLKTEEFKGLFITVFYNYIKSINKDFGIPREQFLEMNICPSGRCLTIVTWFMNIFYTAKYLCGGALNITDKFPLPSTIMSGSTYFAFYAITNDDTNRIQHLSTETRVTLVNLSKEIMDTFDEEYQTLTNI